MSAGNMMPRSPAEPRDFIASGENLPCLSFSRAAGANTRSAISFALETAASWLILGPASNHLLRDQRKGRRTLAGSKKNVNAEAAPRRVDKEKKLDHDQEHVGPRPFAFRVVKPKP